MNARYQKREIAYRGLTRREVRGLREEGLDLARLPEIKEPGEVDEALDRVFALAAPDVVAGDLDALTPGEAMDLFVRVCRATFLSPDQEKNFEAPPPDGSPEGLSTAALARETGSTNNGGAQG
ncbi:MAG: hypothetical protein KKA60_00975 [Proteobacteria bacterium]|nr:hypothetical protein [Pseudomonadota bacterium]